MREIKYRFWDKKKLKWDDSIVISWTWVLQRIYNAERIQDYIGKNFFDNETCWDYWIVDWQDYYCVDNIIPLQYTWLEDKNWKEIYEGDLVRVLYTDRASKSNEDTRTIEQYLIDISTIAEVVFNKDSFCLKTYAEKYKAYNYSSIFPWKHWFIEIIWNIYENPELIK